MKNELGDIPNLDLDDKIPFEDQLPKKENVIEQKQGIQEEQNKDLNQDIQKELEQPIEVPKLEKEDNLNKDTTSNIDYYTRADKFNKTLTIILVAAITIIVVLSLGFGIKKLVDFIKAKKISEENKKLADQIGIDQVPGGIMDGGSSDPILIGEDSFDVTTSSKKQYYKGFEVVGYIRIPKINLNYPILKVMTNKSLETSVALEHTSSGVNKVGNTTISGHNYRNEEFFSNNYKLQVGDSIYVKDMTGKELKYDIYEVLELPENDKSFVQRDTNGGTEISLSTCTDNVVNRLVILAKCNVE